VAVVANITQVLYNLGWNGAPFSDSIWAIIMLVVATIIGLLMIFTRREVAYPLVLTWAFVGIWVKQGETPSVAMVALIAGILLAVVAVGRFIFAPKRV
jgi:hypothetical protein